MALVTARTIADGEGTAEADWLACPLLSQLPSIGAKSLVRRGRRAVVFAPHPDDEVLAAGGLLALLSRAGAGVLVVAVTDGDASHRGSAHWLPERLRRERPRESRRALKRLGLSGDTLRLGLPDGSLARRCHALADRFEALLTPTDVAIATWRLDGHPDHEAVGRAAADAVARSGATLLEAPVWAWHWAAPGDARLPWRRALRLGLDADAAERKAAAMQAFESQLRPDASTGREAVLRRSTLARAARPFEVFFT